MNTQLTPKLSSLVPLIQAKELNITPILIDSLTNVERKELREYLKSISVSDMPRNLFYNYNTQEWID